jgi:hypothetical protein
VTGTAKVQNPVPDEAEAETMRVTAIARDPFWPVGFRPKPSEPRVVAGEASGPPGAGPTDDEQKALDLGRLTEEEQAVIKSHMRVGGILQQGNSCMAILNNQLVKKGDALSIETETRAYTFVVSALTPNRIVLESSYGAGPSE